MKYDTIIPGTFDEILRLMRRHATATTEHGKSYLYLIMESYKLVYEVDEHTLRKLYKQTFNSIEGGKKIPITNKVLVRTNAEKNTHELVKLECTEIELMAVHMEVKNKYEV